MAQHAAPQAVGRKDVAIVAIQLELVIPKDYRDQYPYPANYDAGNVARELMGRWEKGELPTNELLEMADNVQWQVTKPSRLR